MVLGGVVVDATAGAILAEVQYQYQGNYYSYMDVIAL